MLGVPRRADHDEIRRAYLEAARRWHPDRLRGRPAAEAERAELAMREVNQAWAVLGNRERRRAYDQQLVPRAPGPGERAGVRTAEGVTRIDPRLLDPEFLAARREAQLDQISGRSSLILRAAPLVAVLGLLAAILVFTAYARDSVGSGAPSTLAGVGAEQWPLGQGIGPNDCVVVMGGPSLIETDCSPTAAGRVIAALEDREAGPCPLGTIREVELTNGRIACLASAG